MPIEEAAPLSNMGLLEAEMLADLDRKNPPPPEAFELLYDPDAPAAASTTEAKEADMAKHEEEGAGEYKRPDAAKAFEIYDKQIKPKLVRIDTAKGECSQPWQDIKEIANYPREVMNFIIKIDTIEDEAKRDHFLLALSDGLRVRKHFLPRDLVTIARGEDGAELVPTGERDDDELLVDQDEDEGEGLPLAAAEQFTEASEEEVAQQTGRGRGRKKAEPAPGTGAAARAAMSKPASQSAAALN
ncbi:hypothetical protein [Novosphingobium sp. KN65.2]|uniref:hypothetical protein n=1 Tax=Novosphingobium sp. KN65.2 TaxID=1478134 RepID=UPI0005DBD379|nr:hypothetical protein [Novosphingobium sp. KN65.2]CDO34069.1 hypothetical protein SPHV1_100103 [Novosphingobium sp. KN65.2]